MLFIAALFMLPLLLKAQENQPERLDSVVVSSTRAGALTPVTFTTVGKKELEQANPLHSLPMALSLLPSVVTYNEGGTGLGNSAMTIRGSKGSQINVTLNGITLNDSESQEVFWVNIPALTNLISGVQLQRGLGTSANGAGAFGASINMNTAFVLPEPSARIEMAGGSFGTLISSAAVSSGLLPGGFYLDLAWNIGHTDGYIRNAHVGSTSLYAVLGWLGSRNSLRLTYLLGAQVSGITWDGIDPEKYKTDRRYNGAGEYVDDHGNIQYYPEQNDNYAQHHLQLNYTHQFGSSFSWSNTLNYTRGDGFDQYYKTGRKFAEFGFPFPSVDGVKKSDMIYRKRMGNNYWVFRSDVRYRAARVKLDAGVNLSGYLGKHWGEVLWARLLGEGYDYDSLNKSFSWYLNDGIKYEAGAFARAEYQPLPWLTAFADLQYRHIGYDLKGADDKASDIPLDYHADWDFFNPRAGVTAAFGRHKIYASAALGHREPGRSDIKENIKGELIPIKPERMVDIEAGWGYESERLSAGVNIYLMEYWDMLLESGKLNFSGYAIKENVGRGWRRGIEMQAAWKAFEWLRLDGNLTLSTNKLKHFTAYLENWVEGGYVTEEYENTTMLLSPSIVGMWRVNLAPFSGKWKALSLNLSGKYVGKQYWDNTRNPDRCVPAYYTMALQLSHSFELPSCRIGISLNIDNLLNNLYYASAWVYRAWDGAEYTEAGLYPQPPRNYSVKLSLSF